MYLKQTPGSNTYRHTQWNIIHRSSAQGGSFYLWHKTTRYLEELTCRTWSKLHPVLRTGAARFDVGGVWLFSSDQSMLRIRGVYRRLQLWCAIGLHFMCLGELRNKGHEVQHREGWLARRPCSCSRFQSWWGYPIWSARDPRLTSFVTCAFALCSIESFWVSWWRVVW